MTVMHPPHEEGDECSICGPVPIQEGLYYSIEPYSFSLIEEMKPMFPEHWEEVALNRDRIKLNIDFAHYENLALSNGLCIVTVREKGHLVGYWILFLGENPHYKGCRFAVTDIYRILPSYRGRGAGSEMFRFGERYLRATGVVKIVAATKIHRDAGHVFEALGYSEVERVFTKEIS